MTTSRILLFSLSLCACGDNAVTMPVDMTGAPANDMTASAPDGGMAMPCQPPTKYGGGELQMTGTNVIARIVDETGAPLANQEVIICGINLCDAPAKTGPDGSVSMMSKLAYMKPAFHYGDGLTYALLAVPLTAASTDFTTGGHVLATAKLSDKPGATLTPGASAQSGDVTITLPANTTVGLDGLVYDTPDKQKFRAASIPLANAGPLVVASGAPGDFSLLYGVAPADTLLCPAVSMKVALPASLGWAPGTAVEFWVFSSDTFQQWAPYAGWAKASDGVVDSDGKTVSTSPGQGLLYLNSFAIRKSH